LAAGSLCIYCWLANEMSQQVRKIMLTNQTWIYISLYFHKRKYTFGCVTCNIRNIPIDIRQEFFKDITYKRSEHSLSDILRICEVLMLYITWLHFSWHRRSLIILYNFDIKSSKDRRNCVVKSEFRFNSGVW